MNSEQSIVVSAVLATILCCIALQKWGLSGIISYFKNLNNKDVHSADEDYEDEDEDEPTQHTYAYTAIENNSNEENKINYGYQTSETAYAECNGEFPKQKVTSIYQNFFNQEDTGIDRKSKYGYLNESEAYPDCKF